jgi:beta-glucosidase
MDRFGDEALGRLVSRLTLDEKVLLLTGRDSWSLHPLPSIGLRSIVVSDGPVGVRGATWDERSPSANFPSPTALAATWDRAAVRSVGRGLGSEARRKDIDVVLAPTINLHRSPYGGRHFEAFSEDPVLTAELAGEYVSGIQEYGVGATLKHFVANESETDRFTVDVRVDDRTLRELYLLAFERPIVDAGSWLVMSAYNSINGATASENRLLTTPLTDEWGFDGVVISDWTAVRSIESARHPQDLAMPGPHGAWGDALAAAVRAGDVPEAAIDRKVLRILRLAARVGALDGIAPAVAQPPAPAAVREIARTVSVAGSVLLTNSGILPLTAPASLALIGEGALVARTQGGGSATVIPDSVVSPIDGLRARWPEIVVDWARGAVVDLRPAPIPLSDMTDADGGHGVTLTFLDADGGVLARENRAASNIVSFDAASLITRSAAIDLAFRYHPAESTGRVPFAVIGLCDFTVSVDGTIVERGEIRTRPGDDFATAVLTPPFANVALPIGAEGADVVVRYTPVAGGVPDAAAFGIGIPAPDADADALIAEAAALAASRDVAVVVVSTSAEVESEGFDRETLALPGRQDDLVRAVVAANPRTIVVVNTGAPVLLPWRDDVAAILAVWFPGQEFGDALAAILSGDVEPGGRLPTTWPDTEQSVPVSSVTPIDGALEYTEGIHIGYRAWLAGGRSPAYPFGHGLGYTTWAIESLAAPDDVAPDTDVPVSAVLRNTGNRSGKAVVQFYVERASASDVDRPVRWLAGFEAVTIAAGGSHTMATTIPARRFAHWDGAWVVEPGDYRVVAALDVSGSGAGAGAIISVR